MDYHFVKYENEDSIVNASENSPQAINSFIGMKILASHSGFHDDYEDTSLICDSFLDFNKEFIGVIESLFKKDNYLRFYIDFSITSLISICTMKYFERSIKFLRNLAVLANEKYSFLTLHQSHPEILMKSFLLVISLAISRRAPSHFFIKPILNDEEEEEEEGKENKEDREKNNESSLFDRVEDLTSFIKKEYNYFNSFIGSSISIKNQKEIIIREITENGIFPITIESQKIIQIIFDQRFDFLSSEIITHNINQFNLSEYNSDPLTKALNEFSKKHGKKLDNFVCYSNPESYISNALSMKMGILIPTKCPKRHIGFLAANCTNATPANSPSPRCYYCIADRCRSDKNFLNKSSENENDDNFMFFGKVENSESVILLNIYNIIDELHPIEANFLRIILLAIKYKDGLSKKEAQQQINVTMCAIATLLFPYTSYALSQKVTCVFVLLLLKKFEDLYFSLFSDYHNPTPHEFRKLFSALMAPTLKGIFENVSKKLKNPDFLGNDSSKAQILLITPSPLCRPLLPMGSKYFLRSFLLDPIQRTKCPVIYAYLRLNDRFDRVRFIPTIVPFITKIFEYIDCKRGKNINEIKISQIKGYEEFLKNWKMAAKDVVNDLMTTEARLLLEETLVDDPKISFFLPIDHKNWPVMNVLLSCSEAHNRFVSVLNEYRNIVVNDIKDIDISLNNDNFRLRNSFFNVPLLKTIKGNIGQQGNIVFTEEHERNFCDELSFFSYSYIIHSSLSLKALSLNGGESLITQFTNRVSPKPLTFQQKYVISIIKKEGKGVGLALLLESLILKIIEISVVSKIEGKKPIIKVIQDFLSSSSKDFDISSLERDAFGVFMGLKGKTNDPFLIQQIPGIYNMLMSNISESNEVQSYVIESNIFAGNHSFDIEDSKITDQMKKKSLSDVEWLDLACITLQLFALTKNTNKNEKKQTIFEGISNNIKILFLSNAQENLVLEMKDTLNKLSIDDLYSLYMFCSKKTI